MGIFNKKLVNNWDRFSYSSTLFASRIAKTIYPHPRPPTRLLMKKHAGRVVLGTRERFPNDKFQIEALNSITMELVTKNKLSHGVREVLTARGVHQLEPRKSRITLTKASDCSTIGK